MHKLFIALPCVALLAAPGWAQSGSAFQSQRRATPGALAPLAQGAPSSAALLVGGNDNCATPDPIAGTGSFAFDNSLATTGPDGQSTVNCIQFNLIAINNDVWFLWTAPQTGRAALTSCGSTVDTKIAVYAGSTCPTAGASAVACNDDFSPYTLQSKVLFDTTAGQQFLIQIGIYPGQPPATPGAGTFTIDYPVESCTHDDGTTEDAIGLVNPGEICWLERFGVAGDNTTVASISTAWGVVGGTPPPAGQMATVAIWDDPNDDGDPTDAVLLASVATTIQNPGTDMLQVVPLTTPVTVSGIFFLGAKTVSVPNVFVTPLDGDGCGYQPARAWIAANVGGVFDLTNMGANSIPPVTADAVGFGGEWLVRGDCAVASAGTPFCLGDGSATACPCGNSSPVGADAGCLSSLGTGGKLVAIGNTSISMDTVVLQGSGMPNSSALYFQGTLPQNGGAGSPFGDGLRCAGGSVTRLGTTANSAGMSMYPFGANPPVSVKGLVAAPGTRSYQIWYRNAAAFCTPSTFNLTNGWTITWAP